MKTNCFRYENKTVFVMKKNCFRNENVKRCYVFAILPWVRIYPRGIGYWALLFIIRGVLSKKMKNVSCEYDRLNGCKLNCASCVFIYIMPVQNQRIKRCVPISLTAPASDMAGESTMRRVRRRVAGAPVRNREKSVS